MFASVTEVQFKPGKGKEANELALSRFLELEDVEGLKQVITIDRGNDKRLIIGMYENQSQQEAGASSFQETLRLWGDLVAEEPVRDGGEVITHNEY